MSAEVVEQAQAAGIVFDADKITLTGRFGDELSAYRARKLWGEVLGKHFLLEKGRDFEAKVIATGSFESEASYQLNYTFQSACGRYAFWRLVNRQAPEVEAQLQSTELVNRQTARLLLGAIWNNQKSARAIDSLDSIEEGIRETKGVIDTLLGFFRKH